ELLCFINSLCAPSWCKLKALSAFAPYLVLFEKYAKNTCFPGIIQFHKKTQLLDNSCSFTNVRLTEAEKRTILK
ncbi:MAG: hypothetical protein ACLUOT_26955, partial [Bacteroides ovatus]